MLLRLFQALLIALLVYGGVQVWTQFAKPPDDPLRIVADAPLRELFGEDVRYEGPLTFDLDKGAELRNLEVPNTSGLMEPDGKGGMRPVMGLTAKRVRVTHDPLALAAGRYRPLTVEIEGAVLHTRETASGIAADFPLEIDASKEDDGAVPRIRVRDVVLHYRALPDSKRLRPGATVAVHIESIDVAPDTAGNLRVDGRMFTRRLGQDETPITVAGTIARDGEVFDIEARWDPLELTDELLAVLRQDVADNLGASGIRSGTFVLRLRPKEGEAEGQLEPSIEWNSEVDLRKTGDIPGMAAVDAKTREQLTQLFGDAAFQFELAAGKVNIKSLVAEMAGGRVQATGWVIEETGEFSIDFDIRDLDLADEAVRTALGKEGAEIYDEFDPRGTVDAIGRVTGSADGEVSWSVDVLLEDVDLAYVGALNEEGKRVGFPYRMREATGRVRIDGDGVTFDDVVGFNRGAEIMIRGNASKGWTGGETGFIGFTEDGASVALTVVATNVPVDEQLLDAVRKSEFADMLEEFEIEGVVDLIELDLIKNPKIERAVKAEMRLTLEGEQFRYLPFPLPLEDVRGKLTMRRPVLADGKTRGSIYDFDVTGWAEGAPIHAWATIKEHEKRGKLHVKAEGMPLAGRLAEVVKTSTTTKEDLASVWTWLGPRGRADVHIVIPLADDPATLALDAVFRSASIRLDAESKAPLEVSELEGPLKLRNGVVTLSKLTGKVGGAAVTIDGSLQGGVDGAWDLRAGIDRLRLTPTLMESLEVLLEGEQLLPGGMAFEPGSRMTLALHVTKKPGETSEPEIAFEASDLDTTLRLPDGSALSVTGEQLASAGGVVTVRNLRAEGSGITAEVRRARVEPGGDAEVTGRFHAAFEDFEVTQGLLDLLPDDAAEILGRWTAERTLSSKSFLIDVPEKGPITLEGDLALVAPKEGPLGEGARGRFEVMPLIIRKHPQEGVVLNGLVQLGGFSIDLGPGLEDLRGAIEVEHLHLGTKAPQGRGRVSGVSGRIADLTVADLAAPIDWRNNILRVISLGGRLCGGAIKNADFFMHTAEPVAYTGKATVEGFSVAQLRDDLAPSGPQYEGVGTAHVTFQNRGGELKDLTAAGTVAIRKARLGDLPFIANIFTLTDELAGVDERPQFNRADLVFTLQDEVFNFRRFDLAGPLFDLPGEGTLDLTGVIDLRFTPDLVKGLLVPGIMQLPGLGPMLRGVIPEQLIYGVRVHGDIDAAEPELVFIPGAGWDRGREFEGVGPRALPRRRLPGLFR